MPRYKVLIEYDGTDYNGWQRQPKGKTVEGTIEKGMEQILQHPVDLVGQGRTDAGVHAEGQVAHFDTEVELDKGKFLYALLGVLPSDIAVWDLEEVDNDFHARFDAKSRQYRFQIVTRRSPLWERYSEMILDDLDMEAMEVCAQSIPGVHDFESFTRLDPDQPQTECEVMHSQFSQDGRLILYRIRANRFLRHMVRRLVGTMVQVGQGKRTIEEFDHLLKHPVKEKSGHGAAAKGLILEKVEY